MALISGGLELVDERRIDESGRALRAIERGDDDPPLDAARSATNCMIQFPAGDTGAVAL